MAGSKPITYKVRISNHARSDGGQQVHIRFGIDIRQRLGCDYMTVKTFGTKVMFVPDGNDSRWGNYHVRDKMTLDNPKVCTSLRSFAGEYDKIHLHENGYLWVDLADVRPFTKVLPPRSHIEPPKAEPPKEEPKAEPKKPVFTNYYTSKPNREFTLKSICQEQNDRLSQLENDIADAEALLKELRAERDKLLSIQSKANELLALLGG